MSDLNLKFEILPYCRGTVLELTESPIKMLPHVIQVAEGNFDYQGQQIQPDVKVKRLNDLAIFGSKQIDAIILQRGIEKVSISDLERLLKKGAYLLLIQTDSPDLSKFTKELHIETLNLTVYTRN